jgi:uncharacterized protein
MKNFVTNKRKIINDPVLGFINLQSDIVFDLIEHPYFQRLRRIKQLGLSSLVYPGANHTRFEHTIGALHLMRSAIEILRLKGIEISQHEADSVCMAILLHDIGHGPFSHALENTLISGANHEQLSLIIMEELNREFEGKLNTAISIFKNEYPKKFLYQLVSGQLDMDRLDYLRRDSFFSGVIEGAIGSDRIIKMLNVKDDHLVVDIKGIYSTEKFLVSRRLMYWQVYLHKTVIAAEYQLIHLLKRAKALSKQGLEIYGPPQLQWLLALELPENWVNDEMLKKDMLSRFVELDDADIISSVKVWRHHPDTVLALLADSIINRKVFRIQLSQTQVTDEQLASTRKKAMQHYGLTQEESEYLVFSGSITNSAYETNASNILILLKDGKTVDINSASDIDLQALSKTVTKHFLCYPKELEIG